MHETNFPIVSPDQEIRILYYKNLVLLDGMYSIPEGREILGGCES